MKRVLSISIILFTLFSFGQKGSLNYEESAVLEGKVTLLTYEMPTGDLHDTYILVLDKPINVAGSKDWDAYMNVKEVHLNILNNKIEEYKGQKIRVEGVLFHALTIHDRRDVCIKVEKILKTIKSFKPN